MNNVEVATNLQNVLNGSITVLSPSQKSALEEIINQLLQDSPTQGSSLANDAVLNDSEEEVFDINESDFYKERMGQIEKSKERVRALKEFSRQLELISSEIEEEDKIIQQLRSLS